jgi:hypothetical protein
MMIDYDKLKTAHELAKEASKQREYTFAVQVAISYTGTINYMLKAYLIDEQYCFIDDLITKLQEFTQPKPKYETNQKVWYLIYSEEWIPLSGKIQRIDTKSFDCLVDGNLWPEDQLYTSRETLIDAQIEYWHKLHCEDGRHEYCDDSSGYKRSCLHCGKSEFEVAIKSFAQESCQHEGGNTTGTEQICDKCLAWRPNQVQESCLHESDMEHCRNISYVKCTKCGEFY